MASYNQVEFADRCKMTQGKLNVYIGRGKVILTDSGKIDDSVDQNWNFYIKWSTKATEDKPVEKKKSVISSSPSKLGSSLKEDIDRASSIKDRTKYNEELYGLEKRKKAADLNKVEIETRMALLREQKLNGTSIPLDLTTILIKQHFKSVYTSFMNTIEVFITNLTKRVGLSMEQQAEIRGEMIKQLNIDIQEAIKLTSKDLGNVQKEYMLAKQL